MAFQFAKIDYHRYPSIQCSSMHPVLSHVFATLHYSPLASSVHGIFQAGKSTGVVCHFFLQGSSWPRDQTCISCIAGGFFTTWAMSSKFSCTYWLLLHLIWINIYSSPLSILKLGCFLLLVSCRSSFYILIINFMRYMIYKYILTFCRLPFHSIDSIFWHIFWCSPIHPICLLSSTSLLRSQIYIS